MSSMGGTGAGQFSFSSSGMLAYVGGSGQSSELNLVWVDRKGTIQPLLAPPHRYLTPRLSPDGRLVAVTLAEGKADIWIYDLARDTLTRLTFEGENTSSQWTPDGKRVLFTSNKTGPSNIYWKPADGSGAEERLTMGENLQQPGSFTPDGRAFIYSESHPKMNTDLWVLPLDGERKPRILLQTPFTETTGRLSPDGRWLAYVSNESGRFEVYVRPFPGPGGKYQISTAGGNEIVWAHNGELFYRAGDQREKMMVVDIETQPTFRAGKPRLLFEATYATRGTGSGANYSVSPDGQRFLMLKPKEQPEAALTQIHVVLNWFEELKRRVPVK